MTRPATTAFAIFMISSISAIAFLSLGLDAEERLDELNEFRNCGTIKGTKACRIPESTAISVKVNSKSCVINWHNEPDPSVGNLE